MLYIGIDISKTTFDVAVMINGFYKHKQFLNNLKGFKPLLKWIKSFKSDTLFCMESTGIYGLKLAKYLSKQDKKIIVANPLKTNHFAKMEMSRNKTDKADSMSIARYCKHLDDNGKAEKNLFKPKGEAYEALQFLNTRLEQLSKLITQEQNRLGVSLNKVALNSIKVVIRLLEKQILSVRMEIQHIVNQDNKLQEQVNLLTSIGGIGEKTAWSILAYIGDISLFSNAKQVTSYVGLNPQIEQSGTSVNKSSLSKMGNKYLRKSLYMPAIVAKKHNPLMKDLYERILKKGAPKKVALCAVMRKLMVLSYGVLKSGEVFDPCYQK